MYLQKGEISSRKLRRRGRRLTGERRASSVEAPAAGALVGREGPVPEGAGEAGTFSPPRASSHELSLGMEGAHPPSRFSRRPGLGVVDQQGRLLEVEAVIHNYFYPQGCNFSSPPPTHPHTQTHTLFFILFMSGFYAPVLVVLIC